MRICLVGSKILLSKNFMVMHRVGHSSFVSSLSLDLFYISRGKHTNLAQKGFLLIMGEGQLLVKRHFIFFNKKRDEKKTMNISLLPIIFRSIVPQYRI